MKTIKFMMMTLMMCFTTLVIGQDKQNSDVEKSLDQTGSLIKKEFIPSGKIGSCEINKLYITNMLTGNKISGIKLETTYIAYATASQTKTAFIDSDELPSIISSLKIMYSYITSSKDTSYVELIFYTKSGFSYGCFIKRNKIGSNNTRNEKFYIDTQEKTFEGKIVQKDDKGFFIWREISGEKSSSLVWSFFLKLEKHDSNSYVWLKQDDIKEFISKLESIKL